MDIPNKNNFVRSSCLLDCCAEPGKAAEGEAVDALITDEGARQKGFSLRGENLLLECISSAGTDWYEICELPAIIGKARDCDVVLRNEPMANDRHGIIFFKDNRYLYLDMNSINGSIVDGGLALDGAEIKNGSRIQICRTVIKVVFQSDIDLLI